MNWWSMPRGCEREQAKQEFEADHPLDDADPDTDGAPEFRKVNNLTMITFPDGRRAYQKRRGQPLYFFRGDVEERLQAMMATTGQAPLSPIFDYSEKEDGQLVAVAYKTRREYILWNDASARLLRLQLTAYEDSPLIGDVSSESVSRAARLRSLRVLSVGEASFCRML
jgi:hypothetical protein